MKGADARFLGNCQSITQLPFCVAAAAVPSSRTCSSQPVAGWAYHYLHPLRGRMKLMVSTCTHFYCSPRSPEVSPSDWEMLRGITFGHTSQMLHEFMYSSALSGHFLCCPLCTFFLCVLSVLCTLFPLPFISILANLQDLGSKATCSTASEHCPQN